VGNQILGGKVRTSFKKTETGFGIPEIKGRIHYDEKYIWVKDHWEFDLGAIDNKTKFFFPNSLVLERTIVACTAFLRPIKTWCYGQILDLYLKERHKPIKKRRLITFVSDKFANYKNAFTKLFYRTAKLEFGVPIACKKYGRKHNNNPIERHNKETGKHAEAHEVFQTHEGASSTLTLCRFIYNYVTPHNSLKGMTPAEAAGLILPLGDNKLLGLIHLARKIEMTKR
jgi:transposase-like protein